jgi:putative nucleotidyltransferase with HDIG domain
LRNLIVYPTTAFSGEKIMFKTPTYSQPSSMDLAFTYDVSAKGWSKALEIDGWSESLNLRNKETEEHTLRVAEMTVTLARMAGMPENKIVQVRRGALLHDIGRMGIPDSILLTPDKLTTNERIVMRKHPDYAYDLLYPIEYLRPCLSIPYSHHERWDGTGYPQGLKGEQIPLEARIFAVVDVYDALISDRPYRAALSKEKALEHIRAGAGSHFDPAVVEMFVLSTSIIK